MTRIFQILAVASIFVFLLIQDSISCHAQAIKVEVASDGSGNWQLLRDGKPYYVKGAGGHVNLDLLVECGGNSIRTWGVEGIGKTLDEAHARGLTVSLGFWMGHERHGFDYNDKGVVRGQFEHFKQVVEQYKDHPALLVWGIGNEMDLFYSNFKVWDAVEEVAQMIHELDPNHPTMVVTAGLDVAEVQLIQERAPSVDILGVNTYGDIVNTPKNIELYGWDKPYMITEWGPNGHWEVGKTSWDVSIEQTAAEKAQTYKDRYQIIWDDKHQCIGSYVFFWGQKQEYTNTWYGLFDEENRITQAIDELAFAWSGEYLENRPPQLQNISLNGSGRYDNVKLEAGKKYEANAEVLDLDDENIRYRWEVVPESTDKRAGGDVEEKPQAIPGLVKKLENGRVQVTAPKQSGAYRLFFYAYDDKAVTYAIVRFMLSSLWRQ